MLELLGEIVTFFVSVLEQLNSVIQNYLGGVLPLVAVLAALAAYRKFRKIEANQDAMQRLADAIIKQHNKELRDGR